jgi:DNA topoisomerase-6 subunit B
MRNVKLSDGQGIQVYRYANRVPLQFKMRDCAITQTVMGTNWRSYGLSQSRGNLPSGPVTLMVHLASVWVPFTSESKEAIAAYPEIEKEIRLALQAVGRKLGIFLKRRQKVKQEGERRSVFMRYLAEVAGAVSDLNGSDREEIHSNLLRVANRVTKVADTKFDEGGNKIQEDENFGDNVLIVEQGDPEEALKQRLLEGNPQQKLF